MTKMQTVERVYLHESTTITNTKTKRTDYKNGAFLNEVRQTVMTHGAMYSLLSCGHTRKWQGGENFSSSKRLSCHYCDSASWHAAQLSDAPSDESKAHHADVLARNSKWAAENKALVIEHAKAWSDLG